MYPCQSYASTSARPAKPAASSAVIVVELEVDELKAAFKQVDAKLEQHLPVALALGAQMVADEARRKHDYKDRTSELTNSIMAGDVEGSYQGGDLTVTVSAGAAHGIYVEEGTRAHVIRPKHRKALRWTGGNGFIFAKSVNHPGTDATHFLANALDAKLDDVASELEAATELAFHQSGFEV